jgi:hypothetical protein
LSFFEKALSFCLGAIRFTSETSGLTEELLGSADEFHGRTVKINKKYE